MGCVQVHDTALPAHRCNSDGRIWQDPKAAQHKGNMSAVNDGVRMWLRLPTRTNTPGILSQAALVSTWPDCTVAQKPRHAEANVSLRIARSFVLYRNMPYVTGEVTPSCYNSFVAWATTADERLLAVWAICAARAPRKIAADVLTDQRRTRDARNDFLAAT